MKLTKSEIYNNVFSYETKKGTFYAFRYLYRDFTGKRHEKQERGFTTELAAHKAELHAEVLAADNDTSQLLNSSMTIEQWTKQFVAMNEAEWRPNYQALFKTAINKYIIPLLGRRRLDKLTKMEYNYLYIQPQLEHLKPSSVQINHRLFMVIVNAAVDNEIIPRNRLRGIRFKQSEPRKPFSEDDLTRFNNQLKKEPFEKRLFFQLLEMTGFRLSEGLGLEWRDINFKKKTISVKRSRNDDGLGPTKTPSGVRTIAIDNTLAKPLRQLMIQAKAAKLKTGDTFTNEDLLFSFKHVSAHYYFRSIIKAAGIPECEYVIHSLRHTHATMLIGAGVSPVDVAKRLGHSDPSITLKIYSHAIKSNDAKSAEIFANLVNF